jgi:transketolase
LQDAELAQVVLVGTGSEVSLCVSARDELIKEGVAARVVSMPSWELFERQTPEYRASVFPPGVPVLSVEAGTVFGWERYAHHSIGVPAFGASGPANKVYEFVGVTAANTVVAAKKLVDHYKGNAPVKGKLFENK